MALKTLVAGDGAKRITNVVPATSDYTVLFWWRYTGAQNVKTIFVTLDAPGTYLDYMFMGTFNPGVYNSDSSLGIAGVQTPLTPNHPLPAAGTWLPIVYVRSGNSQKTYFNGGLVGDITLDISANTFDETWIGDDGVSGFAALQEFFNFREWSAALTTTEMQAEFKSGSAIRTANLVTDCPLLSDYDDISGNGNDFSAVGSPSFVGTPPLNTTSYTATELGNLPANVTADANNTTNTETNDLWYKGTYPVGSKMLGVWGFGDLINYRPSTGMYDEDLVFSQIDKQNLPIQFKAIPGDVYYLRCRHIGNSNPSILTLNVQQFVPSSTPLGSIFINNDNTLFRQGTILSPNEDHNVLDFVFNFPVGEAGDISANGTFLAEEAADDSLRIGMIVNSEFVESESIATSNTEHSIRYCLGQDKFYCADVESAPTTLRIISVLGVVEDTLSMTGIANVKGLAANNDGTILYYTIENFSTVKQWDLVNNVALPDLVADIATYNGYDILVLSNDTILFSYVKPGSGAADSFIVRQYNTNGILLNTYNFDADVYTTDVPPRLGYALDEPNSYWAYMPTSDDTNFFSRYVNVRITDGAYLSETVKQVFASGIEYLGPETETPFARFGPAESCFIAILRSSTLPPAAAYSGIYQIVPGKTNDTVFTDVNANITLVLKIPDPFARI